MNAEAAGVVNDRGRANDAAFNEVIASSSEQVQVLAHAVRDLVYDDRVAQLYLGPTLTARLRARLEAVA